MNEPSEAGKRFVDVIFRSNDPDVGQLYYYGQMTPRAVKLALLFDAHTKELREDFETVAVLVGDLQRLQQALGNGKACRVHHTLCELDCTDAANKEQISLLEKQLEAQCVYSQQLEIDLRTVKQDITEFQAQLLDYDEKLEAAKELSEAVGEALITLPPGEETAYSNIDMQKALANFERLMEEK